MIYVPPVDPADYIIQATDELKKCINKYFGDISLEEASRPEVLDPKYSPELLVTLRKEYYKALEQIWASVPTSRRASFEGAVHLPAIERDEALEQAYAAATRRSFWEKLGKTNFKDVLAFKQLLKERSEELLNGMHDEFTAALIKINRY